MKKILVLGALGQVGSELVTELRKKNGEDAVFSSDIKEIGPIKNYEVVNVLHKSQVDDCIKRNNINEIYILAAILSANGEKDPKLAWKLNMTGLMNVLDSSLENHVDKVFWPSSIAAFGPTTPKRAEQQTIMEPTTMYGVTKVAGELLCKYYFGIFGLDVRSIRYPGIISYKTEPGGGTTDFAIAMVKEAVEKGSYTCFVNESTKLPLMYIDDAIRGTIEFMDAPKEGIKIRTSYNMAGASFTAKELENEIKKYIPDFRCEYKPDFRQAIADSWPQEIDDSGARKDWSWKPEFDLNRMVKEMLKGYEWKGDL